MHQLREQMMEVRFGRRALALYRAGDGEIVLPVIFNILAQQSRRRALVGRMIALIRRVGLGCFVIRPQTVLPDPAFEVRFQAWEEIGRYRTLHYPLILLPPQGPSRGRLYVYGIAADGRVAHFTKIETNAKNHGKLAHEAETLQELKTLCTAKFRVPRVAELLKVGDWLSLCVEPLPNSIVPLSLEDSRYHEASTWYCGQPEMALVKDLMNGAWWQIFVREINGRAPNFTREIIAYKDSHVAVARAHGDAGPHNFLRDGETIWIVDWEASERHAPILADRIALELGAKRDQMIADPNAYLPQLLSRHSATEPGEARRNLMLALAFRAASGHQEAIELINAWDRPDDE